MPPADVLRIGLRGMAGRDGKRVPGLAQQLAACLIETHHGMRGVVGASIYLKNIFHQGDKRRVGRGSETPLLDQPRLQVVFLSVWRTVSWAIVSTTSRRTNSSASSRRLQRACPTGGVLQAVAINRASAAPSRRRA